MFDDSLATSKDKELKREMRKGLNSAEGRKGVVKAGYGQHTHPGITNGRIKVGIYYVTIWN